MRAVASLVLVVAAGLAGRAWALPPERTLMVDPVELVAGREVPGAAEFVAVHEGYEYRFANAENKARFEKDPARYCVADGGACGRMGPLSGLGDARRFAAHAGRIYLFASDGCRAGFLKEPASHIETDDEMPFGSNDAVLAGRAALDRLVAWMGGAERLRAISNVRATEAHAEKHGDAEYAVTNEFVVAFPRSYFHKQTWNESWFSTVACSAGGAMGSARGLERIAASRARAFERAMARWPLVVAKAHVDGSPKADCPGLVVLADGEGEIGGAKVDFVKVWLNGATSRLAVEKGTGRPVQVAYRGRDGSMRVGDVVRTFTAHATVAGVTLPTAYTVTLDGKPLSAAALELDGFELNVTPAADLFAVPEWAGAGDGKTAR
jgi:YHS domain-containing protein